MNSLSIVLLLGLLWSVGQGRVSQGQQVFYYSFNSEETKIYRMQPLANPIQSICSNLHSKSTLRIGNIGSFVALIDLLWPMDCASNRTAPMFQFSFTTKIMERHFHLDRLGEQHFWILCQLNPIGWMCKPYGANSTSWATTMIRSAKTTFTCPTPDDLVGCSMLVEVSSSLGWQLFWWIAFPISVLLFGRLLIWVVGFIEMIPIVYDRVKAKLRQFGFFKKLHEEELTARTSTTTIDASQPTETQSVDALTTNSTPPSNASSTVEII